MDVNDKEAQFRSQGQQLVTPLGNGVKAEWDKAFVKWLAKSCRPLSLGENDKAFREFISTVTYGRYTPPVLATVHNILATTVAELEDTLIRQIAAYQAEGLMVSVAADIWGENGKSLYGILTYFITADFVMQVSNCFSLLSQPRFCLSI